MSYVVYNCPHCNGNATLTSRFMSRTNNYLIVCRCDLCGAQGKAYFDDENPIDNNWSSDACELAVDAWNERV